MCLSRVSGCLFCAFFCVFIFLSLSNTLFFFHRDEDESWSMRAHMRRDRAATASQKRMQQQQSDDTFYNFESDTEEEEEEREREQRERDRERSGKRQRKERVGGLEEPIYSPSLGSTSKRGRVQKPKTSPYLPGAPQHSTATPRALPTTTVASTKPLAHGAIVSHGRVIVPRCEYPRVRPSIVKQRQRYRGLLSLKLTKLRAKLETARLRSALPLRLPLPASLSKGGLDKTRTKTKVRVKKEKTEGETKVQNEKDEKDQKAMDTEEETEETEGEDEEREEEGDEAEGEEEENEGEIDADLEHEGEAETDDSLVDGDTDEHLDSDSLSSSPALRVRALRLPSGSDSVPGSLLAQTDTERTSDATMSTMSTDLGSTSPTSSPSRSLSHSISLSHSLAASRSLSLGMSQLSRLSRRDSTDNLSAQRRDSVGVGAGADRLSQHHAEFAAFLASPAQDQDLPQTDVERALRESENRTDRDTDLADDTRAPSHSPSSRLKSDVFDSALSLPASPRPLSPLSPASPSDLADMDTDS